KNKNDKRSCVHSFVRPLFKALFLPPSCQTWSENGFSPSTFKMRKAFLTSIHVLGVATAISSSLALFLSSLSLALCLSLSLSLFLSFSLSLSLYLSLSLSLSAEVSF